MKKVDRFMSAFWKDKSGISSVEYALLLAFVAAGIVGAAGLLGDAVEGALEDATNCIDGSGGGTCGGAAP